jgi:FkbM family methyltransferase
MNAIPDIETMMEWDFERMKPRARAFLSAKLATVPVEVPSREGHLRFLIINKGAFRRAITLHTKEPDSLRWIDRMAPGSVFWDIGANVGVLSLYAAQRGDLDVHAFEPGAVNYYLLTGNCEINGFSDVMSCYLLGFSNQTRVDHLEASQFAAAGSFILEGNKKADGTKKSKAHSVGRSQTCLLFTIDDFIEQFKVPFPNYIKIDVPGHKYQILQGAARALARPELREIQIELKEQGTSRVILEYLESFGFRIIQRNARPDGRVAELVLGRTTD